MTVFNSNFAMMDSPGGETEQVDAMKAAGYSGVFCNVHAYQPEQWNILRKKCLDAGLFCGPWARTNAGSGDFKPDILTKLISISDAWGSPLIVNSEVELVGTGSVLTKLIADSVGTRDAAISTDGWISNPPSVDWTPVAHLPCLLQIFPADASYLNPDPMGKAAECQTHAWDCGFKCVYYTFGTYKGMNPSMFKLQAPFSLFTGNQVGARQEWDLWKPTSTGFVACKEGSMSVTPWYKKPYPKGSAVGPDKLPRTLKPGMKGPDVLAMKRAISKAQRWLPWAPTNWDQNYYDIFAHGRGSNVGDTGVAGFQRQEGLRDTGIIDDATYQRIRKSLIPDGFTNGGKHILDTTAIQLLAQAKYEFSDDAKLSKIRAAIADFCERAEAHEAIWHYDERRPYTGLGDAPEIQHIDDCSAYVILAYYWARKITGIQVPDPSKHGYTGAGNTWDDLDGYPALTSGNYLVGDLAHYNGHVTICRKAGDANTAIFSSNGSEQGPCTEPLHYRGDFIKVVRPPLLPLS